MFSLEGPDSEAQFRLTKSGEMARIASNRLRKLLTRLEIHLSAIFRSKTTDTPTNAGYEVLTTRFVGEAAIS